MCSVLSCNLQNYGILKWNQHKGVWISTYQQNNPAKTLQKLNRMELNLCLKISWIWLGCQGRKIFQGKKNLQLWRVGGNLAVTHSQCADDSNWSIFMHLIYLYFTHTWRLLFKATQKKGCWVQSMDTMRAAKYSTIFLLPISPYCKLEYKVLYIHSQT